MIGDVRLYHGSLGNYKELKPIGIDLGNKFQKAGWSIFCWAKKDLALRWIAMMFIAGANSTGNIIDKYAEEHKDEIVLVYAGDNDGVYLNEKVAELIFDYVKKNKVYGYLYDFKIPFYNVGLGNTYLVHEYTVRKNIKKFNKTKIRITEELLRKYIHIVPHKECITNKELDIKRSNYKRPFHKIWNRDFEKNYDIYSKIRQDLKDKAIKIGDDIEKYFMNESINDAFKELKL